MWNEVGWAGMGNMRILVLNPFAGEYLEKKRCEQTARPGTEIVFETVGDAYPLPYVTYVYYRHKCAGAVVDRVLRAEKQGFDGVFISCSYDPGLVESRELVDIPVTGAFESSSWYASMIGFRYSVVTTEKKVRACYWQMAELYGTSKNLVSVRDIGIPANRLYPEATRPDEVIRRTMEVSRKCVEEDGAEVILLGCTLQSAPLTEEKSVEAFGAPIIDPVLVGFKMAEMMVEMKQLGIPTLSRIGAWKKPPPEELTRLLEYYRKKTGKE